MGIDMDTGMDISAEPLSRLCQSRFQCLFLTDEISEHRINGFQTSRNDSLSRESASLG
jgi:hypothetical protein